MAIASKDPKTPQRSKHPKSPSKPKSKASAPSLHKGTWYARTELEKADEERAGQ